MCVCVCVCVCVCKRDLALNDLQWLMCLKTRPNQTKPKRYQQTISLQIIYIYIYNIYIYIYIYIYACVCVRVCVNGIWH